MVKRGFVFVVLILLLFSMSFVFADNKTTNKTSSFLGSASSFVTEKISWITGSFGWDDKVGEYFLFAGLGILFMGVFWVISLISSSISNVYSTSDAIGKKRIILFILYPFLMLVPILKRILQIITLEFLGLHFFWRAFIIAAIFSFAPLFWARYRKYRLRTELYKDKLRKVAIEERDKALLGG